MPPNPSHPFLHHSKLSPHRVRSRSFRSQVPNIAVPCARLLTATLWPSAEQARAQHRQAGVLVVALGRAVPAARAAPAAGRIGPRRPLSSAAQPLVLTTPILEPYLVARSRSRGSCEPPWARRRAPAVASGRACGPRTCRRDPVSPAVRHQRRVPYSQHREGVKTCAERVKNHL